MARSIFVFLTLSIYLAQCATIQGKDKPNQPIQKRDKRSCHYCDESSINGPGYHSLQYSGLARSDDGTAQGVFSGAAAAANFGTQSALPSYSVASSIANAGADAAHVTGADAATGAALNTGAALGTGAAYGIGATLGTAANLGTGGALGNGALGTGAAYNTGAALGNGAAYGVRAALDNGAAYGAGTTLGTGAAYGAGAALGTGAALASAPVFGLGALGAGAYNSARLASQTTYNGGRLTERSVDFGGEQPLNIGHVVGRTNGFGDHGQNKFRGSGNFKEERFSFQSDGGHGESGTFGSNGARTFGSQSSGSTGYGGNEQQVQQSAFDQGHGDKHSIESLKEGQQQLQSSDHGQWQQSNKFTRPNQSSSSYSAGSSEGGSDGSYGSSQRAFNGARSSGFEYNASGSGASGSEFGGRSVGQSGSGYGTSGARSSSTGSSEQASIGPGGSGYGANAGSSSAGASFESQYGDGSQYGQTGYHDSRVGHTALNGALKLASQGLQTAQEVGCGTCGRSSYSFSNAKSKTGDAVAVSIGG